ncbi:MAG: hypothetical protein P8P37_02400 [Candidatus Marinimicrobia bacterium]|nr:hypothetical protein [Candidatus Neomarinimicrobiota bacterium]
MKYIRHQECEVEINGEKIFAKNASLSSSSSTKSNRTYGGGLRPYNSTDPVSSSVQFSYYITGKEDSIDLLTGSHPCSGRFCGIEFSGAYLTNYGVEIEPYRPVQFSASFDIYSGFNQETKTGSFGGASSGLANGAYTELLNFNKNNIGLDFPQRISYSIDCERTPNYVIGLEHPVDVRHGKISKNLSIQGENIGSVMNYSGKGFAKIEISPRNIDYAARGRTLNCEGVINSQNLSVSSRGLLNGSIDVMESVR